ncbi:MAG: protein phosphatase 2C domain-containing protein [Candidatus Bathyarchaeia archaeon]
MSLLLKQLKGRDKVRAIIVTAILLLILMSFCLKAERATVGEKVDVEIQSRICKTERSIDILKGGHITLNDLNNETDFQYLPIKLKIWVQGGEEVSVGGKWSKSYILDDDLTLTVKLDEGYASTEINGYKFLKFWNLHLIKRTPKTSESQEVKEYDSNEGIKIRLTNDLEKVYIILYFEEAITLKLSDTRPSGAEENYRDNIALISEGREIKIEKNQFSSLIRDGAIKLGPHEGIILGKKYTLSAKPLMLPDGNKRYIPSSCSFSGQPKRVDRDEKGNYIVTLDSLERGYEITLGFKLQHRYNIIMDFPGESPQQEKLDNYLKLMKDGKDIAPKLRKDLDFSTSIHGSQIRFEIWLNETTYELQPEKIIEIGKEQYKTDKNTIPIKLPNTSEEIRIEYKHVTTHPVGGKETSSTITSLPTKKTIKESISSSILVPAGLAISIFAAVFLPVYLLMRRQRQGRAMLVEVRPSRGIGLISDAGGRSVNEDVAAAIDVSASFLSRPFRRSLLIVADGIGGLNKGDVASSLCVRDVVAAMQPALLAANLGSFNLEKMIVQAIEDANTKIYSMSRGAPGRSDMGTTITAALICGYQAYIANVGDSRAYIIRDKGIRQITKDHSLVQEMIDRGEINWSQARFHPKRNVITRAVGYLGKVDVDLFHVELQPGDMLLLGSTQKWMTGS